MGVLGGSARGIASDVHLKVPTQPRPPVGASLFEAPAGMLRPPQSPAKVWKSVDGSGRRLAQASGRYQASSVALTKGRHTNDIRNFTLP
jgi:hypothetical protein